MFMSLNKPYKRTIRPFKNNSYKENGNWQYLIVKDFANNPDHYVRSFLLIQEEVLKLFEFIEPADTNLPTFSLKIQQLIIKICIEIEANFTAILKENSYKFKNNWNMKNSYCLLEFSHKLSQYSVKFPLWHGMESIYSPFRNWKNYPNSDWSELSWYQKFNKFKHDRHSNFQGANFETLLNSFSALAIVLSSQFYDETYQTSSKSSSIGESYSYNHEKDFVTGIGDYLKVKFPTNWLESEKYNFEWSELKFQEDQFEKINFNELKSKKLQ